MHQDYTKICRICMSDGSRDIFHKPSLVSPEGAGNAAKFVSPLEKLLEKLRYVTMMKIEENDDLPRLLCDLCIVQLNVAYNFKRQAVENDTKLRQYFIENGITSNQTIILNEGTSARSSFTALNLSQQQQQNQRFPILPLIIKTEPSDVDAFSDVTTETNVEIERNRFESVASNTRNSSPEEAARCLNNSMYSNDRSHSSMVYVNSGYEFNSETPSSDIEFVQNFQVSTNNKEAISNGQSQLSPNASKVSSNDSSNQNNLNSTSKSSSHSADNPAGRGVSGERSATQKHSNSAKQRTRPMGREREIRNLSIDMILPSVTSSPKERRTKLGKTTRVRAEGEVNVPIRRVVLPSRVPRNIISSSNKTVIPAKRSAPSPILRSPNAIPAKKSNSDGRGKAIVSTPKHVNGEKRKSNSEKLIVLNPFNSSKNANRLKAINRAENSSKRKSQHKLLRPKIEPPANKKN